MQKKLLFSLLGILIITILCFISYDARSLLHGFMNNLVQGRSTTKLFGFLFWLLFLFSFSLILLKKNFLESTYIDTVLTRFHSYFLLYSVIFIGITALFSFFLFTFFAYTYDFHLSEFIISFNNQSLSSTTLIHNHLGKAALGILFKQVHVSADLGVAYINLLPNFLYYISGIITLLAVLVSLFGIISYIYSNIRNKDFSVSYLFFIGTLVFVLLERSVDGGIFDPFYLPTFGIYMYHVWLLCKKKIITRYQYFKSMIVHSFSIFIIICLYIKIGLLSISQLQEKFIFLLGFICILYIPIFIQEYKKISFIQIFLYTSILILSIFTNLYNNQKIRDYKNLSFFDLDDRYQKVFIFLKENEYLDYIRHTKKDPILNLVSIEKMGKGSIYSIQSQIFLSVGDIIDMFKLTENHFPVSMEYQTCFPGSKKLEYIFNIKSIKPVLPSLIPDSKFISMELTKKSKENSPFFIYTAKIYLDSCTPRMLNVIEGYISQGTEGGPWFIYSVQTGDGEIILN